jgi:hypothetical protein
MNRWQDYLQSLLGDLHTYQVNALAAFSFAAARARGCHLSRLASHVPTTAQPHSTRRRLLRLLGNGKLNVQHACLHMAVWLKRWNAPSARLLLLLDETPLRNDLRVLKTGVCYKRRALPLLWSCYPLSNRGEEMPETVQKVLERTHQLIQLYAPCAQVILMADRGLCWPQIITFCQKQGWNYILRAQSQTRLKGQDGQVQSLGTLTQEPGQAWCGRAQVFRKAGWIECNVVACWPRGAKEAWLLVTSLPPSLQVCRWYARRVWQEQSFRDEKSHGFCWHESHVQKPERVNRLLLILALAQLWLMMLGTQAQRPQWRQRLGLKSRKTRRLWSYFRTGWHLLLYALDNRCSIPCYLAFTPP